MNQPTQQPGDQVDHFAEAFALIFEAYSRPADTFDGPIYETWAIWQHGKVTKEFTHMQKHRAAISAMQTTTSAEQGEG